MCEAWDVRVLGVSDIATLRQMLSMFGTAFEDVETYTSLQPDDAYIEALLANPGFVAVAASSAQRVIGGIAAYVLPKFEQPRSELYIYDLAVDEACRRQGVATAMIEAVKTFAASRGIHVIYVQADQGDEPAIALYTKMGTREDVLHFDIEPTRRG